MLAKKEGKSVGSYVRKMKGYVEQLERLGYVLPQDIIVGLILNDLTSDFAGFVRNYNMHYMGKTVGKLHALLIKYEKERQTKDDACYHCKEVGHWKRNCPVYLVELIMKKKQVGTASSSGKMTRKPFPHRTERGTDLLGIIHTDNEVENQLGKTIKALRLDRGGEYNSQEFKDYLKACGIVQQLTPSYTLQYNRMSERRNRTLLDMIRSMMNLTTLPLSFWDSTLETTTCILNIVLTKKVDKTPGRAEKLEEIQEEDTSPSENTSEIYMDVEGFEPPQEEVVPIDRSIVIHRAPDRLCLNVEVEEHSLGDLNEPTNYKAAILDLKPDK
nr:hypothetical protein [Tanacetum cinerariifolium]